MGILLSLIFSLPAMAAETATTCSFGAEAEATFVLSREENQLDAMASSLVIAGEGIPSLPAGCVYQNVPGQRGFRCSHQAGSQRFDLYPRLSMLSDPSDTGKVKKLHVIVWENGRAPRSLESTDCR